MINRIINELKSRSIELISIISAILLWQIISDYVVKNKFFLPSFLDVVHAIIYNLNRSSNIDIGSFTLDLPIVAVDLLHSLLHFSIGMILALIVGIPIGILMILSAL